MKINSLTLLFLSSILVIESCNKITPAGFWESYKTEYLIKQISDQGPYGGHRAMYWNNKKTSFFHSNNVLDFANKNGWQLVDSLELSNNQINKWIYNNQNVFPLTHTGFSDTLKNDAEMSDFPRWFSGPVKIYTFKTGWITIQPGTDNSFEKNGFVLFNADKTEMAVYHLWGE